MASKNPRQVGADRIVDAAAVYELYGGPAIVIDYGTATTFDLVDADGTFTACVIAAGYPYFCPGDVEYGCQTAGV